MGFLQPDKPDIFVSYAHVNDIALTSGHPGWVSALISALKNLLAMKLGRSDAFDLWLDYRLAGNDAVTPEIVEEVAEASLLLIVLSRGYLDSVWCHREIEKFRDEVLRRRLGGHRIFLVEFDEVERPPELTDLLGYRFWVDDRSGKAPRTLGFPLLRDSDDRYDRYYDLLNDLSHDIACELRRLKDAPPAPLPEAITPPLAYLPSQGQRVVHLAEATDDLDDLRDEVRRHLTQVGVRILPETDYPRDEASFRRAAASDLARSTLFVRLLSRVAGKKPAGSQLGYVALQYECETAANRPILQWRSRDLDPEGPRVAETLFRLLSERNAAGADIRRPTTVDAVARIAGVDAGEVVRVVDAFRDPVLCFLTPALPAAVTPETWVDLSHESILRQWDRLRDWVVDEAASAETYTHLALWAGRWEAGRAGLWGTPDLDLALAWKDRFHPTEVWAERYGADFSLAMRFLDASQARWQAGEADERQRSEEQRRMAGELKLLQEREKADRRIAEETAARHRAEADRAREQVSSARRQRKLILSAAAALLGLALLLFVAYQKAEVERGMADDSARIAEVLRLSSQSKGLGQNMPRLSVLLAVEAFERARKRDLHLAESEQALRDALSVVGGEVPAVGSTGDKALAFSPKGAPSRLALAGND